MTKTLWEILNSAHLNEKTYLHPDQKWLPGIKASEPKKLKADKKVAEFSPDEMKSHKERQGAGKQWHIDHPVDHNNIVNHYKEATAEEKHHGMNWYKDANHFSHVLAKDTGISHSTMAGLTANYSPQSDWHSNMLNAARVARHKEGVGGKNQPTLEGGKKMMASTSQKDNANRMLKGEHWSSVLKGHKIRAFAHLIEHGGDGPDAGHKSHVCVDRHAYSVAAGSRITDEAFGQAGLANQKRYNHVVGAYSHAANHINKESGKKPGESGYVHPHQLQAVTWLVRQRKNTDEDIAKQKRDPYLPSLEPSRKETMNAWGKTRDQSKKKWHDFAKKNHPGTSGLFEGEEEE